MGSLRNAKPHSRIIFLNFNNPAFHVLFKAYSIVKLVGIGSDGPLKDVRGVVVCIRSKSRCCWGGGGGEKKNYLKKEF